VRRPLAARAECLRDIAGRMPPGCRRSPPCGRPRQRLTRRFDRAQGALLRPNASGMLRAECLRDVVGAHPVGDRRNRMTWRSVPQHQCVEENSSRRLSKPAGSASA
jgi:hypothetical protein